MRLNLAWCAGFGVAFAAMDHAKFITDLRVLLSPAPTDLGKYREHLAAMRWQRVAQDFMTATGSRPLLQHVDFALAANDDAVDVLIEQLVAIGE